MSRFLVLDGYDKAGRAALQAAGATPAGILYRNMVLRYLPEAEVDIVHPADPQAALVISTAMTQCCGPAPA